MRRSENRAGEVGFGKIHVPEIGALQARATQIAAAKYPDPLAFVWGLFVCLNGRQNSVELPVIDEILTREDEAIKARPVQTRKQRRDLAVAHFGRRLTGWGKPPHPGTVRFTWKGDCKIRQDQNGDC